MDEAEHSMEMHLPYLAKVFHGYFIDSITWLAFNVLYCWLLVTLSFCSYPVKVVPILVGALNSENEAMFGKLLAKYVDDPKNFFSVSSDFCHWGTRYAKLSFRFNTLLHCR